MTERHRFRSLLSLTLLGGLGVLLPLAVFAIVVNWLFHLTTDLIQPLTDLVMQWFGLGEIHGDIIVMAFMLAACFFVGLMVKTGAGRWLHNRFDHVLVELAPGYKTVKEIVNQFIGENKNDSLLNGEVCLAQIFGPDTPVKVTAIVTSRHDNGWLTVYVPTAPVPTSGITYHVPEECVEFLPDVSVEAAMRTIIACGAGTSAMLQSRGD